jgi:elongator complex protein 4
MKSASSFQRKSNPMERISGCFKSSYNHHILSSTGVPPLDLLIGGGMPIGTLMLIEEDYAGSYAKLLMKYFLAEGVYSNHSACFSTLTQSPQSIIQNLPSVEDKEDKVGKGGVKKTQSQQADDSAAEQLNIAWRYQNKTFEASDLVSTAGRTFNLNIPISKDILSQKDVEICDITDSDTKCTYLLGKFHEYCKDKGFLISPGTQVKKNSLVRLGVLSLGDILWGEEPSSIVTFLLAMRALLRNCMGVGLVTIPSSLHQDEHLAPKLRSIADFVVNLTAFDSQENVSPVYKDYHGIIKICRISSLGVLTPPLHLIKDDNELVFKSRRTKFEISRFHLPPDLSVTASIDQKDPKIKKNIDIEF